MLARVVRFVVLAALSLAFVVFSLSSATSQLFAQQEPGLTVHEWGTFTSVSGELGRALHWRPLSVESDLPSFVYSVDTGRTWRGFRYPIKSTSPVRVRMETPVVYFYGNEPVRVSLSVRFPNGRITEWFPKAQVEKDLIEWKDFLVSPGMYTQLPHDLRDNHYYPARETDAAVVQVKAVRGVEHEKFLFYRGVGDFELPVSAKIQDGKVEIKNVSEDQIAKVIVFENRGGYTGYQIQDLSGGHLLIERPVLRNDFAALRADLKKMLIEAGLYEKEAEAMLNTWRDSWFEEGLRIFYLMPPNTTDRVLPISIEPKPANLVRVLVGRAEILTPEMEKNVIAQIARLRDPSPGIRASARHQIFKYGRFLEPLLMEVLNHSKDQQFKDDVGVVLAELEHRVGGQRSEVRSRR